MDTPNKLLMNSNLWYNINGNWFGLEHLTPTAGYSYNNHWKLNPYTTAPTTAHILWTKPEAFGGIIGGEFGGTETAITIATRQYECIFTLSNHGRYTLLHLIPGKYKYSCGWDASRLTHRTNTMDTVVRTV